MLGRMSRGLCVAVVALAFSGWAAAQEPKKPEAKPEAKPEVQKPEAIRREGRPKKEEAKDIIATATDAKLATFVELVKLAGLTDELKKPGTFTVFAPTDAAFKAVKDLDDLKKPENKDKLAALLKGHIVAKKIEKGDKTAKSLAGTEIMLTPKDGKCMVNDKIACTKELNASNGMIHVVDSVIAAGEKKPEVKPEMKKEEPKKEASSPSRRRKSPRSRSPRRKARRSPSRSPSQKKG